MIRLDSQIEQIPALMDATTIRHRVITNNLANVNTPGYRRLDVEFESQLAEQMRSPNGGSREITPQIIADSAAVPRADGNNVNIDQELGQLNKNAMLFQLYSQVLRSQFEGLQRAMQSPS